MPIKQRTIYYAIGDIHGEAERLRALHDSISDYHSIRHPETPQIRVHLGDYVDRGPNSFDVINFIMELEKASKFPVINLKGNHEYLMLHALENRSVTAYNNWLVNGGDATIASYRKHGYKTLPNAHLKWIKRLSTRYFIKDRSLVFVHAGIDPDNFPQPSEEIDIWTRSARFFDTTSWENPALDNICVVHGHTPTQADRPDITKDGRRINIDTGACYGGKLTAVALADNEQPRFLYA